MRGGRAWFNQRIPLGGKIPTRLVPFLSFLSFAVDLHLYDRGSRPFEVPYPVLVGLVLRGRAFSLFEGLGANRVRGHLLDASSRGPVFQTSEGTFLSGSLPAVLPLTLIARLEIHRFLEQQVRDGNGC